MITISENNYDQSNDRSFYQSSIHESVMEITTKGMTTAKNPFNKSNDYLFH